MEVLCFRSDDGKVMIGATTAANMETNWWRFKSRVNDAAHPDAASSYCDYRSSIPGSLRLMLPGYEILKPIGEDSTKEWNGLPPVFYETALYNVSIKFEELEEEPVVLHKMKEVTQFFMPIDLKDGSWMLSAPLSFLNEPGIFNLTFRYTPKGGATRTDTFSFRVVSPKLDTKEDYNHILSEINAQYDEIVFQYLTLTLQNLRRAGRSNNDVVWLSIFQQIVDDYVKAVNYIVNRPHLKQTSEVRYSKADRIKRWTPRMAEKFAEAEKSGKLDKQFFRHENTINTHNTRENRFIKFTLDKIGKRLASIVTGIKIRNAKGKRGGQGGG